MASSTRHPRYGAESRFRDAETGGPVRGEKTAISALSKPTAADSLLEQLTTETLGITCKVYLVDATTELQLGETLQLSFHLAHMFTTPAVRIGVQDPTGASICHVNFHFSQSTATSMDGIQDYTTGLQDDLPRTVCFSFLRTYESRRSNAMACAGFSETQKKDIRALLDVFTRPRRQSIKIVLRDGALDVANQTILANELLPYLPGGDRPLLSSLNELDNWSARRLLEQCGSSLTAYLLKPAQLLPGLPVIPLSAEYTHANWDEYCHRLLMTQMFKDCETDVLQRLFREVQYTAKLFNVDGRFLVAVNWPEERRKLKSASGEIEPPLANDQHVKIKFLIDEDGNSDDGARQPISIDAFLDKNPPRCVRHYDVVFRLTDEPRNSQLRQAFSSGDVKDVEIVTHESSHEHTINMKTIGRMMTAGPGAYYKDVLLNGNHDKIPEVDVLEGVEQAVFDEAFAWLINFKEWNEDQLAVFYGLRRLKGRVALIDGPAGTGKTEVQLAIAVFFAMCGIHVKIIAPTNTNVDHAADIINTWMQQMSPAQRYRCSRPYPPSKELHARDLNNEQLRLRRIGHNKGNALDMNEFFYVLVGLKATNGMLGDGRSIDESIDVVHQVISWCKKTEAQFEAVLQELGVKDIEDYMKNFIMLKAAYDGYMDTIPNVKMKEAYFKAFKALKELVISSTKILLVTSGNAGCREVEDWFAVGEGERHIVIADEAAKDVEMNILVSMFASTQPIATFLVGDHQQLVPINNCSQKLVVTHWFNAQINLALLTRLHTTGLPCYSLRYQHRCAEPIAKLLCHQFYGSKMIIDPYFEPSGTRYPGLGEQIANNLGSPGSDCTVRYIACRGEREHGPGKLRSIRVMKHIDIVRKRIWPALAAHFAGRQDTTMRKSVLLLCGYNYARYTYENWFKELNVPLEDQPRINTIDAAQGDEADIVILDTSVLSAHNLGFWAEPGRTCAALSRAKKMLLILGGHMGATQSSTTSVAPVRTIFGTYQYCMANDMVTTAPSGPLLSNRTARNGLSRSSARL